GSVVSLARLNGGMIGSNIGRSGGGGGVGDGRKNGRRIDSKIGGMSIFVVLFRRIDRRSNGSGLCKLVWWIGTGKNNGGGRSARGEVEKAV
ncbi:hypothetical protein, partial [Staphylococcus epidermidis]|uniref:hypothetical protein n=1 Tax=Staphylococcus epidermidis TaxID=1282 RepID=UPI001642E7FD